jgi:hypothetical protein
MECKETGEFAHRETTEYEQVRPVSVHPAFPRYHRPLERSTMMMMIMTSALKLNPHHPHMT